MATCLERIKIAGKIRVGIIGTVPKKSHWNAQTNKYEGFEADLGRLVAKEIFGNENQIEFVKINREERISSLKENRVDIVIFTYAITKDRLEQVDFSKPYFIDKGALLVLKTGPIKQLSDLKSKKVAVVEKSGMLLSFKEDFPEAEMIVFKSELDAVQGLRNHDADAFALTEATLVHLLSLLNDANKFRILNCGDQLSVKQFAVAIQKGCHDVVALINTAIAKSESNGTLKALLKEHAWIS